MPSRKHWCRVCKRSHGFSDDHYYAMILHGECWRRNQYPRLWAPRARKRKQPVDEEVRTFAKMERRKHKATNDKLVKLGPSD